MKGRGLVALIASGILAVTVGCATDTTSYYKDSGLGVTRAIRYQKNGQSIDQLTFESRENRDNFRALVIKNAKKDGVEYSEGGDTVTLSQEGRAATYTFSDKSVEVRPTSN
jgi:hypothetical protein